MTFLRIGGIAGIGFAATIVLGNLIVVPAGLPSPGAETGEAVAFFQAEGAAVRVASAPTPLTWVLATIFGAGAVTALRRTEQNRD